MNNWLLCTLCRKHWDKGSIPPRSAFNDTNLPQLPAELSDMDEMGERLCALQTPFMSIRQLPAGGQNSLTGAVINVENEIQKVQEALLPLTAEGTHGMVLIEFKRMMKFKSAYLKRYVVLPRLRRWLQYLRGTPLYKDEQHRFNEKFLNGMDTVFEDEQASEKSENNDNVNDDMYISSEDNDSSHEGSGETQYDESDDDKEGNEAYGRRHDIDVLMEPATYQNYIYDEALQIAPGEGNKPFGLLSDTFNEEKSFPKAFCGHPMKNDDIRRVHISYQSLAQHHLKLNDRRVASNTSHIFYKLRRMQIIKLLGARHG